MAGADLAHGDSMRQNWTLMLTGGGIEQNTQPEPERRASALAAALSDINFAGSRTEPYAGNNRSHESANPSWRSRDRRLLYRG